MPGLSSRTDSGLPSTVKRKSSGTVSSFVPSGPLTTSMLPSTATISNFFVCMVDEVCCASAPLATPRHRTAPAQVFIASRHMGAILPWSVDVLFNRANDESLGRRSDKVERVARHQGDGACIHGIEDGHVLRGNDPGALDDVSAHPVERLELDAIARRHVLERTEESVATTREAGVSAGAGRGRVSDMANAAVERPVVGPLEDWRFDREARDSDY